MRFALCLLLILSYGGGALSAFDLRCDDKEVEIAAAASNAPTSIFPRKKKKAKDSNRVKRRNRSMGKKLKRKNDDTLRR